MSRAVRRVPKGWEHPVRYEERVRSRFHNAYSPHFRPLLRSDMDALIGDEPRPMWQMYEETTEGTPVSPPCETPEALADWLVAHNVSVFADMTATREQWLAMITGSGATVGMLMRAGHDPEPGWLDGQGGEPDHG